MQRFYLFFMRLYMLKLLILIIVLSIPQVNADTSN